MSDTKPSRAARELAKLIDADWELVPDNGFHFAESASAQERILLEARQDAIEQVAGTIQSSLANLLEMLKEQTCSLTACGHADCDKIRQTLEPWKPEKKTDDTPNKSV